MICPHLPKGQKTCYFHKLCWASIRGRFDVIMRDVFAGGEYTRMQAITKAAMLAPDNRAHP
jgi:hypothetical protein